MKKQLYPLLLALSAFVMVPVYLTSQVPDTNPSIFFRDNVTDNLDYSMVALRIKASGNLSANTVQVSTSPDFKKHSSFLLKHPDQDELVLRDLLPGAKYYVRMGGKGRPIASFSTRQAAKQVLLGGVTTTGGQNNQGTIFLFNPQTRSFNKIHDYQHSEYFVTLAGDLVRTPGGFAAWSISDGTGAGEIIKLELNGEAEVIDTYAVHNGSLMLASDNHLYVVDDWINFFMGGIYRIHSEGDDVNPLDRIIFRFDSDEQGLNPVSPLLESEGTLLGTAPAAGPGGKGTIFRLGMDGSGFTVIHGFSGTDGDLPSGALIKGEDGYLYGVTRNGGGRNLGTIFRLLPDGTRFETVLSFSGENGGEPMGSLLWYDGRLYGTTSTGGAFGNGVIYMANPYGKNFEVLHHFDGITCGTPKSGLVAGENGMLYGTTSAGGSSGLGVIYEVHKSGSRFDKILDFTTQSGGKPNGSLLVIPDFTGKRREPDISAAIPGKANGKSSISVFPNPFRDSFTALVETPENRGVLQVQISDSRGNLVRSYSGTTNSPMQLGNDLEKGIYILKIIGENTIETRKLIKN